MISIWHPSRLPISRAPWSERQVLTCVCCGAQHRVMLRNDGQVSTPDHASVPTEDMTCLRLANNARKRLYGDHPVFDGPLSADFEAVSASLAYELLQRTRLPSSMLAAASHEPISVREIRRLRARAKDRAASNGCIALLVGHDDSRAVVILADRYGSLWERASCAGSGNVDCDGIVLHCSSDGQWRINGHRRWLPWHLVLVTEAAKGVHDPASLLRVLSLRRPA